MKNKKGFTLIELIVVLAILAVIAAIAVPTAFGSIEKANVAADKASIEGLNSAIRMAAVIEKGDATLLNATEAEAAAAKATTIKDAIDSADFDKTSAMLSKGGVDFVPATAVG
ncbi:MAG: prepilin-type N-terminal cleavage/methylation domain-containing protein, partial [Ruthenibacterium sp.]